MNPEIKARWVRALRSGEYKQGTGYLAQERLGEVEHCCLGVLCEIAVQDGAIEPPRKIGLAFGYGGVSVGSVTQLPPEVLKWAGLTKADPQVQGPAVAAPQDRSMTLSLTYLNDMAAQTFEQIADVIEEQL